MNHALQSRLALACFCLLSVAVSPSAHAAFKCDQAQLTRLDAKACALGRQDVDSLRRYVTRTRMIHNLYMNDYVRFAGDVSTTPPVSSAQADKRDSVAGVSTPSR